MTALGTRVARVARVQVLGRDGVTVESRRLFVHDAFDGRRRSGTEATQQFSILVSYLDQVDDLIADAQRLAVTDARETAQGYADALGARLGPLVRLADQSPGGGRTVQIARALRRSAAPTVAELSLIPEMVTVLANCSATWDLTV